MNKILDKVERLLKEEQLLPAIEEIEAIIKKRLNNDIELKNSDMSNLYLWKGKILNEIGESKKALEAIEISSYYKKTIENLLFLRTLNNEKGQHGVVLKCLKELKKLGKNDMELWNEFGNAYLALRDPENALKAFLEALIFEKDNQEIIFSIAVSLYYSERYKESLEWIFKLEFLTYEIATLAIENYRALNDWDGIKVYMKKIRDFDLIHSLGLYLSYEPFYFEILEEIESKDLNFMAMIFLEKARILKQRQQQDMVKEEVSKALKIQRDNPKVIAYAAYYLENVDKISLYLEALEKGQTLEEEYKDWVNSSLGELYYKKKEYQNSYQYSKEVNLFSKYRFLACKHVLLSLLELKREDQVIEYAQTLELDLLLHLKNVVFSKGHLEII